MSTLMINKVTLSVYSSNSTTYQRLPYVVNFETTLSDAEILELLYTDMWAWLFGPKPPTAQPIHWEEVQAYAGNYSAKFNRANLTFRRYNATLPDLNDPTGATKLNLTAFKELVIVRDRNMLDAQRARYVKELGADAAGKLVTSSLFES